MLIQNDSLSKTVDAVCAALFNGQTISARERKSVATWIATRQGLPGAYAETFAGFDGERKQGILLFTGERMTSASARHILGEETCRVLRQLDVPNVREALDRANDGLLRCLARAALHERFINPGYFCCGKCSVGLWRNLLAGGLDRQEERLREGVRYLQTLRDGTGRWRKFPFWYTLLALQEVELPEAIAEIGYASARLERACSSRRPSESPFAQRRQAVAERALARL